MKYIKFIVVLLCLQLSFTNTLKAETNDEYGLKVKEEALGLHGYDLIYDVNSDGIINVFDVIRIKNDILSLETSIDNTEIIDVDVRTMTFETAKSSEANIVDEQINEDSPVELKQKKIENATVTSSGRVERNSVDLFCYKVTPDTVIDRISVTDKYNLVCYAFFVDEPEINSISYNNNRSVISNNQTVENIVVPNNCNWIAVKTDKNTSVSFKYTDTNSASSTVRNTLYIGNGRKYTTLTQGLGTAFSKGNCDVFIGEGIYDLIAEGTISQYSEGIPLGNGCKYYFASNSKVVCNYTGTDESVMENFSCFKTGDGTHYGDYFELHNCTIEASKIRYCVHDEGGSAVTTKPYVHVYEGCNFSIDNIDNSVSGGKYYHCIGGGLGNSADITITNCKFNSIRNYSQAADPVIHADVSYHGNWSSSEEAKLGKSNIKVTNSYFAHAFQISAPNTETSKKYLLFSGNSYRSSETTYGVYYNLTTAEHWDVDAWNNYNRG